MGVIKNTIANTWTAVVSNTSTSWATIKTTITTALTEIKTAVVNNTRSIGSVQVVVNGYNAQNDEDLADTVVHRINEMLNEDSRVWGR